MKFLKIKPLQFIAIILFSLSITAVSISFLARAQMEKDIAQKVVRFHVRADSNSQYDQQLKILVRNKILAESQNMLKECKTKEESIEILNKNKDYLRFKAQEVLVENGCYDSVTAMIDEEVFPLRQYGKIYFPAGKYTSFVVEIGSGRGKNWWCVMFPQLCYVEEGVVTEDEETQQELKHILTENEYNAVTEFENIEISFKTAEIFKDLF